MDNLVPDTQMIQDIMVTGLVVTTINTGTHTTVQGDSHRSSSDSVHTPKKHHTTKIGTKRPHSPQEKYDDSNRGRKIPRHEGKQHNRTNERH
jgi:hypothetical protein